MLRIPTLLAVAAACYPLLAGAEPGSDRAAEGCAISASSAVEIIAPGAEVEVPIAMLRRLAVADGMADAKTVAAMRDDEVHRLVFAAALRRQQAPDAGAPAVPDELRRRAEAALRQGQRQGVVMEGDVTSTHAITENGISATYTVASRDGRPWLTAVRDGKQVWSGPVGTPAERALVPEELITGAAGLGLDFAVVHAKEGGRESLEVRSGGGGSTRAPQ